MKEIKITYDNNFKLYERFGDILHIISPYFRCGGSHMDVDGEKKDVFCVYSQLTENPCIQCRYDKPCIKLSTTKYIPDIFFDRNGKLAFCHVIYVNGVYAGSYCSEMNILNLTDWTHDRECAEVAQSLLPKLFKALKLKRLPKIKIKREKIKTSIGADPEFEEMLEYNKYTPIYTNFTGLDTEIGRDGEGSQVELRPAPANSSRELVQNIKDLIKKVNAPLSVKGDRYALGAHIHFGLPENMKTSSTIKACVQALDDFLGRKLLSLSGRARGSYASLGKYETKPWGFEYRSLPSAYLINPEIARIVFKASQNIIQKLLSRKQIKYQNYPDKHDYKKVAGLTEKEYTRLNSFVSGYSVYNGVAINRNWCKPKIEQGVSIRFSDDWTEENKKIFLEQAEKLKKIFHKYRISSIRLYGLKKERGNVVAGFTCRGYEKIEHPIDADTMTFGLPYSVRMDSIEAQEARKILLAIITEINLRG